MPKRLQNTDKWQTPFYRKLSPIMKCFYQYVYDNCDFIGLWTIDFEAAVFYIGAEISQEEVMQAFDGKIEIIGDKMLLLDFCKDQYGDKLNEKSSIHKTVTNRLLKENLLKKLYPNCSVEVGYEYPNINNKEEYNKEENKREKEKEKINKKEKEISEISTYVGIDIIKNYYEKAKSDDIWLETVALQQRCDTKEVLSKLEGFFLLMSARKEQHNSLREFQQHFVNKLQKEPPPTPKQSAQRAPLSHEELLKLGMKQNKENNI